MTREQLKRLKEALEFEIASNTATAQNEDVDMAIRSHCSSHAQGLVQALGMVEALEKETTPGRLVLQYPNGYFPQTLAEIEHRECRDHPGETYTPDTDCPECAKNE